MSSSPRKFDVRQFVRCVRFKSMRSHSKKDILFILTELFCRRSIILGICPRLAVLSELYMLYVCSERFSECNLLTFSSSSIQTLLSLSQLSRFYGSLQSRLLRHTPVSQLTQAPKKRRNCTILRTHNGLITARANATLINNSLGFFVPSSDGFHLPSLLLCYFFPLFVNFLLFLLSSLNFFYIYIFMLFFAALAACIEVLSNIHFKTPIAGQSRH